MLRHFRSLFFSAIRSPSVIEASSLHLKPGPPTSIPYLRAVPARATLRKFGSARNEVQEPATEDELDDADDDVEVVRSQDLQKEQILEEIIFRLKSKKSDVDGQFWPDRCEAQISLLSVMSMIAHISSVDHKLRSYSYSSVNIDLEFPSVTQQEIEQYHTEKLIDEPTIEKAAAFIFRKKKEESKQKKLTERMKTVPDHIKKAIAVDELPIEEKAVSPKNLPKTFDKLGVTNISLLKTLLDIFKVTRPTDIQAIAIPQVMAGRSVFIAAQTGTGKTFAYLLPLLQRLHDQEKRLGEAFKRRGQRARAIIVVPTRELAEQTFSVVKLCLGAPDFAHMTAYAMAGGITNEKSEHRGFNNGVDILISTPDRLVAHLDAKHLNLDDTRVVVIDEADTMFSFEAYEISLKSLLKHLDTAQDVSESPFQYQFLWVSATVSKPVASHIAKEWPDAVQAFAPSLHKSVENLTIDFMFGSSGQFKERLLINTLRKFKGARTIIFCNSHEKVKFVYNILEKKGYKVNFVTSDLTSKKRQSSFREFAGGEVPILVTTDLASRGIDTRSEIEHVILYDFPTNAIDYLHRIGRTGRAGAKGRVTAFVAARDQSLVQNIRQAYEEGRSLANVSAAPPKTDPKKKKAKKLPEEIDPKYLDDDGKLKKLAEDL